MSQARCACCGRLVNTRAITTCSVCGEYICEDCSAANSGKCSVCVSAADSITQEMLL